MNELVVSAQLRNGDASPSCVAAGREDECVDEGGGRRASAPHGHRVRLGDRDFRLGAAGLLGGAAVLAALPQADGPPCPLRHATGVPCPLCGLTTSVTETVTLDLGAAIAANPGGPVLVALALAVLAGPGRRLTFRPGLVYLALPVMWLWELHRFAIV